MIPLHWRTTSTASPKPKPTITAIARSVGRISRCGIWRRYLSRSKNAEIEICKGSSPCPDRWSAQ